MKKRFQNKRFRIWLFATLFMMVFIFLMSAQNGEDSERLSNGLLDSLFGEFLERILPNLSDQGFGHDLRKYAHMFEYFLLGLCSANLFLELMTKRRAVIFSWLFCFAYAGTDEWHQIFVPGRAGQFRDVLIDSAGFSCSIVIIVGILIIKLLDKRRNSV